MSLSGEPLELQLQRERVARSQVEAALESTRLQLIEMELALKRARQDATQSLMAQPSSAQSTKAQPALAKGTTTQPLVDSSPQETYELAQAATATEPVQTVAAVKTRSRRAAPKPANPSLVEVARAAEAIEKKSRELESQTKAVPMVGMVPALDAKPIMSSLDLFIDDNLSIVKDFISHLQTRLSKMQGCYGSGNLTELKGHVKWIFDNAIRMGFEPLHPPMAELVEVLENQQNERIGDLLDQIVQLGERVVFEPAKR